MTDPYLTDPYPKWHREYNEIEKKLLDKAAKRLPDLSPEQAAAEAQRIADALLKYATKCQKLAGY